MQNHGKIKSQEDFKKIREENTGIILITDNATGNQIHTPSCSFVTEADFQEKVITNQSKNGDYFWYANITHTNKTHSKVELCSVCDPDLYEKNDSLQ